MKLVNTIAALFAGCVIAASPVLAQDLGIRENSPEARHMHVTPQQKQASDADISAGLSQLQSAAGELQSGNGGAAMGTLNTAIADLKSALPIYHGYRDRAIGAANHAVMALERNGKRSVMNASERVGKAITDAQTALTVN